MQLVCFFNTLRAGVRYICTNGWRPGPGEVGQGGFHFDITHKKSAPPTKEIFSECKLQELLRLLTLRPGT